MLNKPLKITDMGCGFGNSSLALASIFPHATVHGLDIDGDSILKSKANINHPNVTFTGKYLYFLSNIRIRLKDLNEVWVITITSSNSVIKRKTCLT